MSFHITLFHSEREAVQLDILLSGFESIHQQCPDLLNVVISYCKAANRYAIAMHHNDASCVSFSPIVSIRIPDVEGEVIAAVRIHLFEP